MEHAASLTPEQRDRERLWVTSLVNYAGFTLALILVAKISGSQSMLAELVRLLLMFAVEVLVFIAMRRIHRGRFSGFEFGHGKIEQLANFGLAVSFLFGGLAILVRGLDSLSGDIVPIPPFGMTIAAVYQAASILSGLLLYLGMRRAMVVEATPVLVAQTELYRVRLVGGAVVFVLLTIAALTYDSLVAHWLDAIGALVVATLMLRISITLLRGGLPDLLDRGLDQAAKQSIEQVLKGFESEAARVTRLRTRRAAGRVFVQLEIRAPASLTLAQIDVWRNGLKASLLDALGDCDVTIQVESEIASTGLHP